ncbi:MAG: CBS domain-containing protein [Phycisphaeraceae bacterium]
MIPKRQRKPVEDVEFRDQLKNYDIAHPQDDLERALCEGIIRDIHIAPFATTSPISTVEQAVRKMAGMNVGCLLVIENEKLVGIFTQRDLLMKVIENYEAMKGQLIREVMTADPVIVRDTDPPAKAINLMGTSGFRHIPVLDVDDKVVGLIGPRRTTAYLQKHLPAS